ncbi:hypothetical protein H2204_011106 [Knufia peltigerae]|uniref:Uncharacterized protein n=1 Tax=Knufia peltigerae TaxID=1002370 RepID=A0AA39CU91_9EURO|nr:hypothetical protein H2204_011106 [Knufia peltigerae]
MSANSGNGGVRNLRAMFENKTTDQASSPPSRGRSPNPSEFSNGSRPVSKVRASFVAVERPGENGAAPILGLRRTSDLSSRDENRENSSIATFSPERRPFAREMSSFDGSRKDGQHQNDSTQGGLGDILKGSAFADNGLSKDKSDTKDISKTPSKAQVQEKKHTEVSSKPKEAAKATGGGEKVTSNVKNSGPAPKSAQPTKSISSAKVPPVKQIVTKPAPSTKSNPAPKSPLTSKSSPKTPTSPLAHIRGGPAKIKGVMDSAKRAQEAREAAAQKSMKTTKPQSTAPAPAPRASLQAKQSSQSIKKDPTSTSPKIPKSPRTLRPKSPTRPARLPAAATAPTAASAAKHDAQRSPTETAPRKSIAKRPSTASMKPPRASMSSSTGSGILAKKASRASLANGHGNGHERPTSRVSTSRADEGFLARMMRPTASSAQKVHDKVQVNSPPRSKPTASHKHKEPPKHKIPPPEMQLEVPEHGTGEVKDGTLGEEDHTHEVAGHPSLQVVEEDTQPSNAEVEAPGSAVEHAETEAMQSTPVEAKSDLPMSVEPPTSDGPASSSEGTHATPSHINEKDLESSTPGDATEVEATKISEDAEPKSSTPAIETEPKTAVPAESAEPTTSVSADATESVTGPLSTENEPANKDNGDV